MTAAVADKAKARALWSVAFRPFFLAAAAWSAGAIVLWIGFYMQGGGPPSRFDPLSWHMHAMLFGFAPAAIAGFLFTAIANWTGRPPIHGGLLVFLVALWLAGRIAVSISALLPAWVAPAVDLAFPAALFALAAREILAARNWRNLMMLAPLGALTAADALMFLEIGGFGVPPGLGWRLALAAIIALVTAIGGRIIPAFTRNWLVKEGALDLPGAHGLIDSASLAASHTGLLVWAFLPASPAAGALLLIAAALVRGGSRAGGAGRQPLSRSWRSCTWGTPGSRSAPRCSAPLFSRAWSRRRPRCTRLRPESWERWCSRS